MTDTSEEAARKRAQEQLTAATAAMVTQGNIEAETAEAEKKAKKEAKRKVRQQLGTAVGIVIASECHRVADVTQVDGSQTCCKSFPDTQ